MTEMFYEFKCGCKIPQKDENIKDYDGLPPLELDFFNLPLDCPSTWNLLGSGKTRGVFQLDSNLGRAYSKKLAPDNLYELAALTALIRPGCLQHIVDGKSMTDHFIERKHGREKVSYPDNRLEKYYGETYGVLTYQEQMIRMAGDLAGFDGKMRNKLRKACGKKDVEALYSLRDPFIKGCMEISGMSAETANEIFDNVSKTGRYAFNKSHSFEYGLVSYITAYAKAHFPLHFFCSALKFVKDEEELRELMAETALFQLDILPPNINNQLARFNITNGAIQYGWNEVKGASKTDVNKMLDFVVEIEKFLNKEAKDFSWYEFLVLITPKVGKETVNNLISCGLLDNTGITRKRQLHEYQHFLKLSNGEDKWVQANWQEYQNLESLLCGLVESSSCQKKRKSVVAGLISALEKPGKSLQDNVDFICDAETELLGVSVSQNKTQKKEHYANIKVVDFLLGRGSKNMNFVVEVKEVDERTIKTGQNIGKKMANLKLADRTGEMECTIFSREWAELRSNFVKGNVLLLVGSRNQDMTLRVDEASLI